MAILTEAMRREANERYKAEAAEIAGWINECVKCIETGADFPEAANAGLKERAPVQWQSLYGGLLRRRKALALQATIAEALADVPPDKNMGFEYQRRTNKLLIAILLKLHEDEK